MSSSGLDAFGEEVQAFVEARDWGQYHAPKELAIGVATEGAELLELFRFLDTQDVQERLEDPVFVERIEDEMGDVLFFLVRLSQALEIDLVQAAEAKLAKSREKYPVDAFAGDNWKVLGHPEEVRPTDTSGDEG